MDRKFIEKYGEDILCYRLRTARTKKQMQYEDFEKQLIQLDKEQKSLYTKRRNLGWEPLIPPVQKGWKRFYVLRDDVARSKQAFFYQSILDKINTYTWSYRKDFLVRRRKFVKKIYVVKGQKLLEPYENHFRKLCFTEREQQLFYPELRIVRGKRELVKSFVFIEPWRFVLRIKPNIIDKVKVRDVEIEMRLKAIDNYLTRNDFKWIQIKLLSGNCKWRNRYRGEKASEVSLFKNWPIEKVMDSLREE